MRKSLLIWGGAIATIAIVITAIVLSGVIEQEEKLVLSNYPKLFEKEVVIVIGENATQMEYEGAEAIAENLHNITGNMPVIKSDTELTEDDKAKCNLILVGGPRTNRVLEEVYEITDATRITEEYPGENKGILEILRNPWNEEKAMLLVEGSDEWGVKAASGKSEQIQELNKASVVAEFIENDSKRRKVGSYLSLLIDTKGLKEYYSVDINFSHELSNKELTEIEETYNLSFSRLPNGTIAHTDKFYGGLVDGYAINQLVERSDVIRIVSTEKPVALPQGEEGVI